MKYITHLMIFFLFTGCASSHFSNYWPYSQITPTKVQKLAPKEYEDCLPAIDSILNPVVKKYFKNQDSLIAVIELCEQIGGYFTTNWGLYRYNKQYHWPYSTSVNLPDKPVEIASRFISDGIYHPEAMLRIMFSCYYKYLNGQQYNWENEISKVKNLWPKGNPVNFDSSLPDTILKQETEIISDYYFNLLNERDTVNILYNKSPGFSKKSPDWYYLTGKINYKLPAIKSINIRIIDIQSKLNRNYMIMGKDTLFVGDTLTNYHKGWLSKARYYFDYKRCKEYRE